MIEVTQEIVEIVNQIAEQYRTTLKNEGKIASGDLVNFTTDIQQEGKWFSIIFNLQDYWKYVENGRQPGKFPPIDAIARWIEVKPIIPRAINNKVPTTKQLAFLIGRSISENGIQPTKALQTTLESPVVSQLEDTLCDLIIQQIENEIIEEEI